MSYKSKNIGIILYNIYVDTHVFRWNKTGTRRVSSNSIWPWGMWPNSARVYFYRQCPSCKLSPRGNTHFYRSLCIRPRSRGKRRTRGCQCRMSPQSSVLQREIKRRDIIWALILWYFRALLKSVPCNSMYVSSLRRYFAVAKLFNQNILASLYGRVI